MKRQNTAENSDDSRAERPTAENAELLHIMVDRRHEEELLAMERRYDEEVDAVNRQFAAESVAIDLRHVAESIDNARQFAKKRLDELNRAIVDLNELERIVADLKRRNEVEVNERKSITANLKRRNEAEMDRTDAAKGSSGETSKKRIKK